MLKNFMATCLAALTVLSLSAAVASAADNDGSDAYASYVPDRSEVKHLNNGDKIAETASVYGTFKLYGGKNSKNSKHNVYYTARYSDGKGWKYSDDQLMAKGQELHNIETTHRGNGLWKLELNPYGVNTENCYAKGYIRFK